MKCTSCGAAVQPHTTYCPMCGQRVDGGAEPSNSDAARSPAATSQTTVAAASPSDKLRSPLQPAESSGYPAETELWEGGYSPKAMTDAWVVSGLLSIALVVAAALVGRSEIWAAAICVIVTVNLYLGLLLVYRKFNVHYRLTSQRFVHQRGILRRVTDRIEVIDFDDITFEQGLFARWLNVGTILIISGDPTDPKLALPGIDNVAHVAGLMDDARRAERRRRGLHIDQR